MLAPNYHYRNAAFAILLVLSACGTPDGEFPSLERRPFETASPVVSAPPAVAPTILSSGLAEKVKTLVARHESANASFGKGLPSVQKIAANAAGSAAGSESWVNAHMQLSRLDKTRADSVAALGELDTLIADEIDADSAYVTLLVEYQQNVANDVAAQRAEIDRMSNQIGE